MRRMITVIGCVLAMGAGLARAEGSADVTLPSLLEELVDLRAPARVPSVPFSARMDSSRDPASTDPSDPKTWFANMDRDRFLRTERFVDTLGEREEWVLVDLEGPGAVVRLWTAMESALATAVVRVRLDGASEPVVVARFQDLLAGRADFPLPLACVPAPGSGEANMGSAGLSYFPIPFARRCVISLDQKPGYWQISSRRYAEGAAVESLAPDWRTRHAGAVARAVEAFGPGPRATLPAAASGDAPTVPLAPGQRSEEHAIGRGQMVVRLEVGLGAMPPDALRDALRSVWLEVDVGSARCVSAPIGHFFGLGECLPPVADRAREALRGTDGSVLLVSRLPMPATDNLALRLSNRGDRAVAAGIRAVQVEPLAPGRWRALHAAFREELAFASDAPRDWRMSELSVDADSGGATLIGTTLAVMNPVSDWWGEGDEKIRVDGEAFPSHFGTGSEDYFGCAWGFPRILSSPLVSVAMRESASRTMYEGRTAVSRMRALDDIPFERALQADIEWIPLRVGGAASVGATTFWYAPAGHSRGGQERAPERVAANPLPPNLAPIDGLIEAESLPARDVTAGTNWQIQPIGASYPRGRWGSGQIVYAAPPVEGGGLTLVLPAPGDAPVRLIARFVGAPDYGRVRVSTDGATWSAPIDLRRQEVVAIDDVDLGRCTPVRGRIAVRIESLPASGDTDGRIFGIDGFRLAEP